jgi:alpha-tubulin suppressor-like RCC1 family protein/fibronectin type 3 domain-containing protein
MLIRSSYLSFLASSLLVLGGGCAEPYDPPDPPPPPVDALTAAPGDGLVELAWTNPSHPLFAGVVIRRGTDDYPLDAASGAFVYDGKDERIIDGGLSNGVTYYYRVFAYSPKSRFGAGVPASATPQVPAPGAPTGVTATAGNTQVTISWNPVSGATSYNLYFGTSTGVTKATGTKTAAVTSPYAHTGLANGTTYYYVVTAANAGGESPESAQVGATPQVPAPGAPTGVSASPGNQQVTVSWNAVTGATSYNLYWSTSTGATKSTGTKIAGVTSPYAHTGLTNGTAYYYVVTAVNVGGESGESAQVSATPQVPAPGAPASLAMTVGNGQVTLSWSAVSGATSYHLYWRNTSGVTRLNGNRIADVTSPFTHIGLLNGTTYYYVVTAVSAGGESAESAQVGATPQVPAPAGPGGVSASPGNQQVTVSWNAVTGATSYNLYWSTIAGVTKANGTKITNASSPFVHTGLANGTTYYYVVTAVNAGGESGESGQVSATPQVPAPGAPTGVTASPGDQQVTISWNAVTGAISYNLYWSTIAGVTKANGTQILNVAIGFIHTARTNGTTYYYVVTAVSAGGESGESGQVSATPQVPAPGAPTGVTASPGDQQVTVSWNAVTGATSYNLYWSTIAGVTKANGTKITNASSPFVHTGLTNGTTYYYVVTAANAGGESAESGQVSATTPAWASAKLAAAGNTSIAVRTDGTLWIWGDNNWGQLGLGDTTDRYNPTRVGTDSDWSMGGAGGDFVLAIKSNGTLWSWGYNEYGELGRAASGIASTPAQVGSATNWFTVTGSYNHSLGLRSDGSLWAWGLNGVNQLGTPGSSTCGFSNCSLVPIQVGSDTNWSKVGAGGRSSANNDFSVAIKSGTLWRWGFGIAGSGDSGLTQVGTLTTWTTVAAGTQHALALRSDGTLWAWGENGSGQLGLGDTSARAGFTQVGNTTTWIAIAAGSAHSLGLRSDGTLWAWGENGTGQVGTTTTESCAGGRPCSTVPIQVGTATNWVSIAAGGSHSLGLRSDGTLWAWGYNSDGQLGLGDSTNRFVPTQVP